jgi:predicted DNA-binding WGR domain protein
MEENQHSRELATKTYATADKASQEADQLIDEKTAKEYFES